MWSVIVIKLQKQEKRTALREMDWRGKGWGDSCAGNMEEGNRLDWIYYPQDPANVLLCF